MLKAIMRWFNAPIFPEDEDKTRRALLLNVVLNTFLIAVPVLIIGAILGRNIPQLERIIIILTLAWLTIFVTKLVMHSGRVTMAGVMTVVIIFIAATLGIYNLGTIRAPATSFYLLTIVMSGLVISRRAIIWMASISSITIILFLLAENNGLLPPPNFTVSITQGTTFAVVFIIISILLYLAVTRIDEALARVRQELSERQLAEKRFRGLLEFAPDAMVVINSEGIVLITNSQLQKIFGYTDEEVQGHPVEMFLPQRFADIHPSHRRGYGTNPRVRPMGAGLILYGLRKDGSEFPVEISLSPMESNDDNLIIAAIRDITERVRADEALRKSEELYRTLAHNFPNGTVALFDRDLRYTLVDGAGLSAFGTTSKEQLEGRTLWEVWPPDRHAEMEGIYRSVLAGQTIITERMIGGRVYEAHYLPVRNEQGEVYAGMVMTQDITERKRAEEDGRRLINELEIRNTELERFTYTISHELKSPIVTMKGYLGSIDKDLSAGNYARAKTDLSRISTATDKMHETLADLLELSRVGRIVNTPEEIELTKLIREALETVHGRLNSRRVKVNVAPELPGIYGDHVRLREVFENLIDNAVKYMGDQSDPLIEIGVRDGKEPVFFVKDNGMGIEPQYQPRIFGLFDKLDATSEGTGIGLALVKRIIETHGGRIWVESEGLGRGSAFCFTIPDGRTK